MKKKKGGGSMFREYSYRERRVLAKGQDPPFVKGNSINVSPEKMSAGTP